MSSNRSNWLYGLSLEQREKADAVLREPRRYGGQSVSGEPNHALEGWSLYRIPSIRNPPDIALLRYRDTDGRVVIEVDCS